MVQKKWEAIKRKRQRADWKQFKDAPIDEDGKLFASYIGKFPEQIMEKLRSAKSKKARSK